LKKVIILTIVSMLIFCCYNVMATTPLNVYIQAPDSVGQGEDFTIFVQLTNNQIKLDSWALNLNYNPSLVTVLSAELSDVWNVPFSDITVKTNCIYANAFTLNPIIENCTLMKVVFRTISYGNLHLNINETELANDGKYVDFIVLNKTVIIEKVTPAPPIPPPPNPSTTIPPNANAGGIYQAFVDEVITFDGSGSNDSDGYIVSYDWDLGNGQTKVGKIITYTYTTIGNYEITLTVTDNDGLKDTDKIYAIIENKNDTQPIPPDPGDGKNETDGWNHQNETNGNQTIPPNSSSDAFRLGFVFIIAVVIVVFAFWYWRKK